MSTKSGYNGHMAEMIVSTPRNSHCLLGSGQIAIRIIVTAHMAAQGRKPFESVSAIFLD
jgi:hypothetical protein